MTKWNYNGFWYKAEINGHKYEIQKLYGAWCVYDETCNDYSFGRRGCLNRFNTLREAKSFCENR